MKEQEDSKKITVQKETIQWLPIVLRILWSG